MNLIHLMFSCCVKCLCLACDFVRYVKQPFVNSKVERVIIEETEFEFKY